MALRFQGGRARGRGRGAGRGSVRKEDHGSSKGDRDGPIPELPILRYGSIYDVRVPDR